MTVQLVDIPFGLSRYERTMPARQKAGCILPAQL